MWQSAVERYRSTTYSCWYNVVEGSGSSVTFEKNGRRAYFHRLHPQREALIYRVKMVREFLIKLEITP
jgi:hypothetical protein